MRERVAAMLLILLALPALAFAQSKPAVLAGVEPKEATVGDVLTYTATITWPEGLTVLPPDPAEGLGSFHVLSRNVSDLVQENGVNKLVLTLKLACYQTGPQTIPPLEVHFTDESGDKRVETGPELEVNVLRTLSEDVTEIRDIKAQGILPPDLRTPLIAAAVVLALAALGFLLATRIRRKKRKEARAKIEKPEPVSLALSRLNSGQLDERLRELDVASFYLELTDILREYLEGRFEIFALELTTRETAHAIKPLAIDGFAKTDLIKILERADMSKFARIDPDLPAAREDLEKAREFIEKTRPRLEAPDMPEAREKAS